MLNNEANKALISWEPISDQIVTARFYGKHCKFTVIQIYAPTNTSNDNEKEAFYEQLQEVFNNIPSHDLVILMGDFNSQLSSDRTGYESIKGPFGRGELTDNGERMLEFCVRNEIKIMNTYFRHKNIHKTTWTSPDGQTHNEIDYICISRRWSSSVTDVRAKRGADIGSDHELLLGKLKLKLRKIIRRCERKQPFDIDQFNDNDMKERYAVEVRNAFQILGNLDNSSDIENQWTIFKNTINEAAEKTIGRRRGTAKERWISKDTWDVIDQRQKVKKRLIQNDNVQNREEYRALDKAVKTKAIKDKREWFDKKAKEAEDASFKNDTRTTYKILKTICPKNISNSQIPIKNSQGKSLKSEEEVQNRWVEHFSTILNQPIPIGKIIVENKLPILDIDTSKTTLQEIKQAILRLKNNKAPADDGIHPEMLKYGGEELAMNLQTMCETIWEGEKIPSEWQNGTIIPLPKKRRSQ